jgi:hypothetical protein
MFKNFKNTLNFPFLGGVFVLAILLIFSLSLRQKDFKNVPGAQNLEATYHTLLTITALNESPAKNHWYLPTISLGKELDKNISWGATVPTKTGDYIYTSFPPLGFLAPYFWFKSFGAEPSVKNLAYFNFFIGSLSAFVLFLLLVNLLKFNGYSPWVSMAGALIGSTIGIFSREALQSHGIIYWSHSLYQPILIFSLYFIFKYLTSETKERRRLYEAAIIVMVFLSPLTEWTAYVFNVGLIFLLWLKNRNLPPARTLAIKIFITTAIAAALTVIHFGLAIGFRPTIGTLLARFLERNTSTGSIVALIQGYGLSYGLFILITLTILALSYFCNKQQVTGARQQITFFIFIAACIPLLENIIMLQHATQFSFDRLKFIFPTSLILAFSFARFNIKLRVLLLLFILLACFYGYKSYTTDMNIYTSWSSIDAENKKLASQILRKVDIECTMFSSKLGVRGYAPLLFHRGIYEYKSIQDAKELSIKRKACAFVYLDGTPSFPDLQKYTKAIIIYNNGSSIVIANNN